MAKSAEGVVKNRRAGVHGEETLQKCKKTLASP
jgi:hypothetical protein